MFDDPTSTFAVLLFEIGGSCVMRLAGCSALRCAILTESAGFLSDVYTCATDLVLADHFQDQVFRSGLAYCLDWCPLLSEDIPVFEMAWCTCLQHRTFPESVHMVTNASVTY